VACLKTAITQSNANGQDNTILLAAGVYTLDAIDNYTDGANGLPSVTGALTIRGAGADLTTITRLTPVVPPGQPAPPRFRLLHVAPPTQLPSPSHNRHATPWPPLRCHRTA